MAWKTRGGSCVSENHNVPNNRWVSCFLYNIATIKYLRVSDFWFVPSLLGKQWAGCPVKFWMRANTVPGHLCILANSVLTWRNDLSQIIRREASPLATKTYSQPSNSRFGNWNSPWCIFSGGGKAFPSIIKLPCRCQLYALLNGGEHQNEMQSEIRNGIRQGNFYVVRDQSRLSI